MTLPAEPNPSITMARSTCPIATTLDILGDKWTLIIVRDMLLGKKRFSNLQRGREGIPTNILSNRLKKMAEMGVIKRTAYQTKPERFEYELTEMGRGLIPVLHSCCRWANKYIPGTYITPGAFYAIEE